MANMRAQGERWGAVFETEDVESVDFTSRPFTIRGSSRAVQAQSVIIATGRCGSALWRMRSCKACRRTGSVAGGWWWRWQLGGGKRSGGPGVPQGCPGGGQVAARWQPGGSSRLSGLGVPRGSSWGWWWWDCLCLALHPVHLR
ncbi:unnamed protein product [Discosporangium mesarthrocarpum]